MIKPNKIDFDKLSFEVISKTELSNFQSSMKNFPEEFHILEKLLSLYKLFIRSINSSVKEDKLPQLHMYFICLRELLISTQLIGQAHLAEGLAIISRASEAVGYTVAMDTDKEKGKIWVEQSGKKDFKKLFGEPFPRNNKLLHPTIFKIYNTTRDYGEHANFGTVIHFVTKTGGGTYNFSYSDINDELWIKRYLLFLMHSFFEFLVVFECVFNETINEEWKKLFKEYKTEWIKYKSNNHSIFKI